MLIAIILVGLLLLGVGFIITEKNAKYLLAGYNTMDAEERTQVEIKPYLVYFRKFHVFLGTSLIIICVSLYFLIGQNAAGIVLAVYPLGAYFFFIIRSSSFFHGKNYSTRASAIILIFAMIGVLGLLYMGFKDDTLEIGAEGLIIHGLYGEEIALEEIKTVSMVPALPVIKRKSNGFALGDKRKGYFMTKTGEEVKLILSSATDTLILIERHEGPRIYFSSSKNQAVLLDEIQIALEEAN